MPIGRNEPCPCGSGKKFKACCLPRGRNLSTTESDPEAVEPSARFRDALAIALSSGVDATTAEVRAAVALAASFVIECAPDDAAAIGPCLHAVVATRALLEENEGGEEEFLETFLPRLPFDVVLDGEGRTAGDVLLRRHGASLPQAACDALRALVEADDALCRITRTGGRLFVEDVGTGTRLPAADSFRPEGPGMICRLVSHRGRHVPLDAAGVDDPDDPWYAEDFENAVKVAREFCASLDLTLRSRAKGASIGFELLDLAESKRAEGGPGRPEVRNTEGHELVFTTLRWDVKQPEAAREALARLEGLELDDGPEGLTGTLVKVPSAKARKLPGESVTEGTLKLEAGTLTVETNSVERAERLRRKLVRALGKSATFRSVTSEPLDEAMKKPVDPVEAARRAAEHEELMANPEVLEALAEMARDHSLAWCDMTVPVLGNRKPRTLVKTEKGRAKVEALLADFEAQEAAHPGNALPMDFALVRRELGLRGAD